MKSDLSAILLLSLAVLLVVFGVSCGPKSSGPTASPSPTPTSEIIIKDELHDFSKVHSYQNLRTTDWDNDDSSWEQIEGDIWRVERENPENPGILIYNWAYEGNFDVTVYTIRNGTPLPELSFWLSEDGANWVDITEDVVMATPHEFSGYWFYDRHQAQNLNSKYKYLKIQIGTNREEWALKIAKVIIMGLGSTPTESPEPSPGPPPTRINLVKNGDFEKDLNSDDEVWNSWGGTGTHTREKVEMTGFTGFCLHFAVPAYGVNPWDVQLTKQKGDYSSHIFYNLAKDIEYTIKFKAKANKAASIKVILQDSNNAWKTNKDFAITESIETYSFTYTPDNGYSLALIFGFGGNTDDTEFYLDDIELSYQS